MKLAFVKNSNNLMKSDPKDENFIPGYHANF